MSEYNIVSNVITQKVIENVSASLDTVRWALFHPKNHHQTSDKCICNTQYTANCVGVRVGVRVGEGNLIAGCKHSSNNSIKHME